MSDAAHNRTVDGTRTGIQQRVKLECEREQQEQLLLSVIPAYIAAEVSLRLCFACKLRKRLSLSELEIDSFGFKCEIDCGQAFHRFNQLNSFSFICSSGIDEKILNR